MAQHESEKNLEGHKRVLGLWGFAAVAYFAVAGGPFGIEAAVMHAGPLPCFIGFLVLPIVWSLPQALMTAELATLLPDNGGYVLWVTHAFGDFAGWIAGLNGVIGSVIDLTLYPVLFGDIVVNSWMGPEKPNFGIIYALRLLLVIVGVLLNLRGVANVSIVSMIISFGIVIPFVISLFAQLPAVSHGIHASGETAAILDWTAFLSTMLWSFTGWDSLGCIAGEVINPKRTFFLGTVITMAFVTVSYTLTLFVSITTHPDYWNWDQGSFAKFAGDVGSWLGVFATTAALLAQLGIFSTGLSTSSRAVWALAGGSEVHPALLANGGASTDSNVLLAKIKEYTAVVHLPKFLAIEWTPTGVPVTSIFAHGIMICLMCLVPFDTLVQADVMLSCIRLLLEVLAFIWLRMQEPAALRDTDVFIVSISSFSVVV
jgi:amino acid transporter